MEECIPDKIKQRLYPCVLNLFAVNDFHRVTMRDISKTSKVSSGTIYKYFGSKEALLFTILEEYIEEIHRLIKLHIQGIESTREKFHKAFWVLMDYYDKNSGLAVTYFVTVPTRTWMQRGSYLRYDTHEFLSEIIEEGIERKEIDSHIPKTQITGLFFLHCQRAVTTWYLHGMQWSLADSINNFFPTFWKTISLPPVQI